GGDDMLAAGQVGPPHLVAHGGKISGEGVPLGAGLYQNRVLDATKIDECARCRGVEVPVDQADDGLEIIENDRRAAGTAEHEAKAVGSKNDGRTHRTAGPL